MKITLAPHIVREQVGNHLFLLDSVGKQVYCLPHQHLTPDTPDTRTVVVADQHVAEAKKLIDAGVATPAGSLSRRAVIGSTGALLGGGLLALSLPKTVMASSQAPNGFGDGPGPQGIPAGSWAGEGLSDGSEESSRIDVGFFVDDESDGLEDVFGGPVGDGFSLEVFGRTAEFEVVTDPADPNFELSFEPGDEGFDFFENIFATCPTDASTSYAVQGRIFTEMDDEEQSVQVVFTWVGADNDPLCN